MFYVARRDALRCFIYLSHSAGAAAALSALKHICLLCAVLSCLAPSTTDCADITSHLNNPQMAL